jgi:hypothetical protein
LVQRRFWQQIGIEIRRHLPIDDILATAHGTVTA